jgi:hypothetical protein
MLSQILHFESNIYNRCASKETMTTTTAVSSPHFLEWKVEIWGSRD